MLGPLLLGGTLTHYSLRTSSEFRPFAPLRP